MSVRATSGTRAIPISNCDVSTGTWIGIDISLPSRIIPVFVCRAFPDSFPSEFFCRESPPLGRKFVCNEVSYWDSAFFLRLALLRSIRRRNPARRRRACGSSCVILKRMGPADQVTSHMYSFGLRGKQFQYVEGKLPEGFPFHGRMTDHDVRNLQGRGAEVMVLDAHYTAEDLKQARDDCRGELAKVQIKRSQNLLA